MNNNKPGFCTSLADLWTRHGECSSSELPQTLHNAGHGVVMLARRVKDLFPLAVHFASRAILYKSFQDSIILYFIQMNRSFNAIFGLARKMIERGEECENT